MDREANKLSNVMLRKGRFSGSVTTIFSGIADSVGSADRFIIKFVIRLNSIYDIHLFLLCCYAIFWFEDLNEVKKKKNEGKEEIYYYIYIFSHQLLGISVLFLQHYFYVTDKPINKTNSSNTFL